MTSTNKNDSTLTSRCVSWAPTMSNMRWSEYSPWELSAASSGHGSKPPSLLDELELVQDAETFLLADSPLVAATPEQPGLPVRALWSRGLEAPLLWLESSWLAWIWGRACWAEEFWARLGGITALGTCGCCDVISGPDGEEGCLNPFSSGCLRLLQLMSYVRKVMNHILSIHSFWINHQHYLPIISYMIQEATLEFTITLSWKISHLEKQNRATT